MLTQSLRPERGQAITFGLADGIQICFTVAKLVPPNTIKGAEFSHLEGGLSLRHHFGS